MAENGNGAGKPLSHSKVVWTTAIGAALIVIAEWIQAGTLTLTSFLQVVIPALIVIFFRDTLAKLGRA